MKRNPKTKNHVHYYSSIVYFFYQCDIKFLKKKVLYRKFKVTDFYVLKENKNK